MAFVKYDEKGRLLGPTGKPAHIVGINYVASYICTNFWEDWRPDRIEKDLAYISKMGLQAVRIPMFWGYMEPEEGKYNTEIYDKFNTFLNWCKKYELLVMPWFLVGVATRHYDVPFRNGRPFFTGEMVDVAANHLKHFIGKYKDEETILFWDICDEPEFYSMQGNGAEQLPLNRKDIANWVKSLYDAIKSVDPNHLVTLGFGGIATGHYGDHIKDMAEILDLMVVTCYPHVLTESNDKARNNYFLSYNVKANKLPGKHVFTCEAPGYTNSIQSEDVLGRFFKVSLYSNFINGSTGVLPWVFNDFDEEIWCEEPLDKFTHEPGFGIKTVDGRLKQSGVELRSFAKFANDMEIGNYIPVKSEIAILLPEEGYYSGMDDILKRIYASFLLVKGCGTNVDLLWDDQDFSNYKLLIISGSHGLTTSVWKRIEKFVHDGGTVYFSGEFMNLYASANRLFGFEIQASERDHGYEVLRLSKKWGDIDSKVKLFPLANAFYTHVKPTTAEVLCQFDDDIPAVLVNQYGKGKAYFAAKSLESGLLDVKYTDYLDNDIFKIYNALIDDANINRLIRCDNHRIEIGHLTNPDNGENLIICINHDINPVKVQIEFDADLGISNVIETFEPAGVRIYRS